MHGGLRANGFTAFTWKVQVQHVCDEHVSMSALIDFEIKRKVKKKLIWRARAHKKLKGLIFGCQLRIFLFFRFSGVFTFLHAYLGHEAGTHNLRQLNI